MRKQLLTLALCALTFSSFAKIMIVDNNGNNPQNYTSLQKAIDDSGKGDTLYVKGSNTSYGDATIKKSLVLIGDGYAEPTVERPNSKTTIHSLTYEGDDASNSVVKGMNIEREITIFNAWLFKNFKVLESNIYSVVTKQTQGLDHIDIINCIVSNITFFDTYISDCLISNNLLDVIIFNQIENDQYLTGANTKIQNNWIRSFVKVGHSVVKNNYFAGNKGNYCEASWIIDNIVLSDETFPKTDLKNNQYQGNILGTTLAGYLNDNINSFHVYDTQGQVHDEVGIFSGTYAWVDGTQQQPGKMPSVHSLSIDNKYLPANDTLKVNFKARSIRD